MSRFWPVRETSQSDYERLREQVLLGAGQLDLAAARFGRLGLAALIARPSAASPMIATVVRTTAALVRVRGPTFGSSGRCFRVVDEPDRDQLA